MNSNQVKSGKDFRPRTSSNVKLNYLKYFLLSLLPALFLINMDESSNSPTNKAAASNPKISVMVITAITSLDEKNGSSLHAIKKFIGTQYKVDAEKMAVYIKKYLKKALENGELVQKTGKGANGSFAINRQKGIAKKTESTRAKLLKMRTSTPKLLKPKKGKMQQPDESPVFRRDSDSSIEVRLTPESTKVPAEKTKKPNANGEKVKKPKADIKKPTKPKAAGEKATKTKAAGEKATKTKAAGEKATKTKAAGEKATKTKAVGEKATKAKDTEKITSPKAVEKKVVNPKTTGQEIVKPKIMKRKAVKASKSNEITKITPTKSVTKSNTMVLKDTSLDIKTPKSVGFSKSRRAKVIVSKKKPKIAKPLFKTPNKRPTPKKTTEKKAKK